MDFFINSKENEYTPVLIEEDSAVMFNARYKDLKNEKQFADYQYMENVYSFDLKESVSSTFDEILEQGNHHAVVSKNLGSDTIVLFYQNLLWVGSIYQQRLTKQQPLPKNLSNFYFQPHGVFSRDNKEFYFSAMKTETDNLDIYVSNKLADGNWSNPIKIKGKINSGESEDSPFLSKDSKTMYFSSKGHNSSGGYDIFKSHLINGEWSEPEILPTPYNSAGDDIYFTLSENEKYGYLSSNRLGGFGRMDLYEFGTVPKATFDCEEFASATTEAVNIEFTAKEEYLPYEQIILDANNSSVEGYSLNYFYWMVDGEKLERNGPIILLDSLQLGEHEVKLQIFGDSKMQRHTWCASAKFTVLKEATFDTTAIASAVDFISKDSLDILMDQNSTKPLIDFKPSPIYFGFDKTELTEKSIIDLENLKLFLNENPKVKIILTGHTDAMGDASYNDLLAKDRALEAANYLLNNGISKNRIVKTLGKGEKEPANPNELSNGADNIAGRKLNRRVEFTLLIE
jgi:outer membrane protein OmpA-like peptidoglycan-associated protein